jgi:hypothetical protein
MTSAYPKVLQLGDRNVADIFEGIVEVTEKIDQLAVLREAGVVDAATAEQMVRDAYLYRWGLDRDNSTVYLAGPLDCGGIREVDVHGSKGPL